MKLKGNIFITGGSGFLGRGIMYVAKKEEWKARFTVYSRDEYKQDKCKRLYPDANYILGDICDTDRLSVAMVGHDIVIHTAALKYIPEGELNASECVRVNIGGAQSVIKAARQASVPLVIGISTDKAVSPVNVYGMSKAIMERLFAEASKTGNTKFVCCRYGNVIGSTGSVIPLFQYQLKTKGRITVTHPFMTRFWISVEEAVDLINASVDAPAGSVIIPQPAAMYIKDLAIAVGANDDTIDIIGIRPGEKMDEDLLNEQEVYRTIKWHDYYALMPAGKTYKLTSVPGTLCSSSPSRWVSLLEMAELIDKAELI